MTFSYFPFLLVMIFLNNNKFRYFFYIFLFCICVKFFLYDGGVTKVINFQKLHNSFYKAEHKCVDAIITEYDLDQGLSHYNQSRYFELFLKNKIKILAYRDDLTPDFKASSSSRYSNNQFDFILLRKDKAQEYKDSLDLALLTSDLILDCGNFEILIFNDKFSLESF